MKLKYLKVIIFGLGLFFIGALTYHFFVVLKKPSESVSKKNGLKNFAIEHVINNNVSSTTRKPSSSSCRPVRYYRYTLGANEAKFLKCGQAVELFNVSVPDEGYALASLNLVIKNTGNHNQIYFWNASISVGNGEISYAVGDDICPGAYTNVKNNIGYGYLGQCNNQIKAYSVQGAVGCTDNNLVVFSGAYLDVWVEDPSPECRHKDIFIKSYYADAGFVNKWQWPTFMKTLHTLSIPNANSRSKATIFGVAEGSPDDNPNRVCGQEVSTLILQTVHNGKIIGQKIEPVPASGGMGHLAMSSQEQVVVPLGTNTFQLNLGANIGTTPIFTGGCCGDAMLGVVYQE